jgi:hypothetical protein
VLNATNIFGVLDNVLTGQRLDTVDGIGSFLVHYGAGSAFDDNQIVLTAFELAALLGDYNDDGTVDAADFIVWSKNEGTTNMLPNDPIGGTIGALHLNNWQANYGRSLPGIGGVGGQIAVPEPNSLLLVAAAAMLLTVTANSGRQRPGTWPPDFSGTRF